MSDIASGVFHALKLALLIAIFPLAYMYGGYLVIAIIVVIGIIHTFQKVFNTTQRQ